MKVSQTVVTIKFANFKSLENFHVYNVATSCISSMSVFDFKLAGRYCAHEETAESAAVAMNCDSNLQDYLDTLSVSCQGDESEAAILTWTPDEDTPDVVYYQVSYPY